jgi:hypothetical protein
VKLGGNSSYLALGRRTPVYGCDGGLIGVVKKVECDHKNDVFGGLVLSTPTGERYLPGEQVRAVSPEAVVATIPGAAAGSLLSGQTRLALPDGIGSAHASWGEMQRWIHARTGLGRVEDPRLRLAQTRGQQRERALRLARDNPALALEAGVGRPDIPGAFHGQVVDVNNAGAGAIASLPGITQRLALNIIDLRERINEFSSLADLGLVLDLDPDQMQALRGRVVFLPGHDGAVRHDPGPSGTPAAQISD